MGWLFGGMFEKIVHRIKKIVAFFEKANLNSPIQEPTILKGGGVGWRREACVGKKWIVPKMEGIRALTVFVGAFEKWIVDFFCQLTGLEGLKFCLLLKEKIWLPPTPAPAACIVVFPLVWVWLECGTSWGWGVGGYSIYNGIQCIPRGSTQKAYLF